MIGNIFYSIFSILKDTALDVAGHFPRLVVYVRYFYRFGHFPDLHKPEDLNEKILYLKLFSDTSQWSRLADKYAVRDYISSCGLGSILVPVYGVWENPSEVRFDELPSRFMLKATNGDGKGTNILVDKTLLTDWDYQQIYRRMAQWVLAKNTGALSGEPQYKHIQPRIIAEKVIEKESGAASLTDYKIWCFNGRPYSFLVCSNRKGKHVNLGCYDLEWNYHPENMRMSGHFSAEKEPLPRPRQLERMIHVAQMVSRPFPQVRVDLYEAEGQVWFGELTFTSLGGMMNYYTPAYLKEMGNQVSLPDIPD